MYIMLVVPGADSTFDVFEISSASLHVDAMGNLPTRSPQRPSDPPVS